MTQTELLAKAKPILFNTEMVRAILGGRKTQTRRLIKPPAKVSEIPGYGFTDISVYTLNSKNEAVDYALIRKSDILYVREAFAQIGRYIFWYKADSKVQNILWSPSIHMPKEAARIFLKVTDVRVERLQDIVKDDCLTPTRIHKEGIRKPCLLCIHPEFDCRDYIKNKKCDLMNKYKDLWNSTIKKSDRDKYGWDANPWVWVYEFERMNVDEK